MNAIRPGPLTPSPSLMDSFDALDDNDTSIPPDTTGAVGPNHLFVTLNTQIRIQNRAGVTHSTSTLDTFFGSLSQPGGSFDPHVIYDPYAGRWILTAVANAQSAKSNLLLAVSTSSDPTSTWHLYSVRVDSKGISWADYPNLGFNKNWIVVTINLFPNVGIGFNGTQTYVFDKADAYSGGTGKHTRFITSGKPPNDDFSIAPAVTYDSAFATEYMVEDYDGSTRNIRWFTITGAVGSEVLTQKPSVTLPLGAWADSTTLMNGGFAPQLGSTEKIDTDDARLISTLYRNGSLWVSQTVFLPQASPTRSSAQWFQMSTSGTVQQAARIDDTAGKKFFGYPSIAVNKNNDMLIGYSRFAANQYAGADYAFRAGSDPPNTLRNDTVFRPGLAPYNKTFRGPSDRWGDYSNTLVDPTNDTDMWTIQEYAALPGATDDLWGTWWGYLVVPFATHFSVTAPASATAGASFNVTVKALDKDSNVVTGYGGTVHFSSSDGAAVLPANSTLSSGIGTFKVTLKTAATQTIKATDASVGSITGSASVAVKAASATHYTLSAPSSVKAGVSFKLTVKALDAFGNVATSYAGTAHFTSTDPLAVLPANSTLVSGTKTFSVTLKTKGARTVTATDTVKATIKGSANVNVT